MSQFNNILGARRWRVFALTAFAATMLCGCLEKAADAEPAATNTSQNAVPSISGTPGSTVTVGVLYSFQPTARDPEGATLSFSIQNKPAWASFSAATGSLSGTPTAADVGTTSNIVISTNDGAQTASLPAFTLTVAAAAASGSIVVEWIAPTTNSDGSALTDLAGHRIYYGPSAAELTRVIDVPGATTSRYTVGNLAAGTYYISVAAYSSAGVESSPSNPVAGSVL